MTKDNSPRPKHLSPSQHPHENRRVLWNALVACVFWSSFVTFQGMKRSLGSNKKELSSYVDASWIPADFVSAAMDKPLPPIPPTNQTGEFRNHTPARVEFFDPSQPNCSMGSSAESLEMKFLGCGYNGQVFAVSMDCNGRRSDDFVVKLLTFPANKSDTKKFIMGRIGTYKSDTDEVLQKHEKLYRLLLSSNNQTSAHNILDHFAVRLGYVQVPRYMIQIAMAAANQSLSPSSPYRGMIFPVPGYDHYPGGGNGGGGGLGPDEESDNNPSIRGQIFANLQDAQSIRVFAMKNRYVQSIAKDLIFMYRHLFQIGVVICDIKWEHLLFSPKKQITTLVDFDTFRYTNLTKPGRRFGLYAQQWQLWQLLVTVAHVCDYDGFRKMVEKAENKGLHNLLAPAGLASISCGNPGGKPELLLRGPELLADSFQKCQMKGPEIPWKSDMMNNPHAVYDALVAWSGLTDKNEKIETTI